MNDMKKPSNDQGIRERLSLLDMTVVVLTAPKRGLQCGVKHDTVSERATGYDTLARYTPWRVRDRKELCGCITL